MSGRPTSPYTPLRRISNKVIVRPQPARGEGRSQNARFVVPNVDLWKKKYYISTMCTSKIQSVKSISVHGVRVIAAPCGKCCECRKKEQLEWSFRLKSELLALNPREWYAVFFTMTYNDENLPHFPQILLNEEGKKYYEDKLLPQCFSKSHVRDFHTSLRHWLEENGAKDEKKYKWITCAEYGEHTKRCHYHTLLCVPSFVDKEELFAKVNELWTEKGFIFPKYIDGGYDKYGYFHKPFVVENLAKAAGYVSKYISKDIAFEESIDRNLFKKQIVIESTDKFIQKKIHYRTANITRYVVVPNPNPVSRKVAIRLTDYTCFHLQSRSLGSTFADKLTNDEKISFIQNGYFFDGDDFCNHVPKYMLTRFLFENYYLKLDDKRLCRRTPTEFFKDNYEKIFENKVKLMSEKLENFQYNYHPRLARFFDKKIIDYFDSLCVRYCDYDKTTLSEMLVAYVGCNMYAINPYKRPVDFWFKRYCYHSVISGLKEVVIEEYDYVEINHLQERFYEDLNKMYFMICYFIQKIDELPKQLKLQNERNDSFIRDFYNNIEVA